MADLEVSKALAYAVLGVPAGPGGGGGGGLPPGSLGTVPSVFREGGFRVLPHTDGSSVGTLDYAAKNNAHAVRTRAPDTLSADYIAMMPIVWLATQATFPTLSADNAGLFIYVTDYAHLIYWDGTSAGFAGDPAGRIEMFLVDPGAGWHLCDGSLVSYLNPDGTLGNITLPDLAGSPSYPKLGGSVTGIVAPTAGTITGNTADAATGITLTFGGSVGTGISGSAAVVDGLTDPQHHHAAGTLTVSPDGEVRHIGLRAWFRQ